jgi:hypothetical protein
MSIVSTTNLYLDTSRVIKDSGNKGDNCTFQLGNASIQAGDGQIVRLALQEFTMPKVWSDVNANNSVVETQFDVNGAGITFGAPSLTHQNYLSIHDIALDFQKQLANELIAVATASGIAGITGYQEIAGSAGVKPPAGTGINGTSDNIISFSIELLPLTTALNITTALVQMFEGKGDSAQLLGGNRIVNGASTDPSITVSIVANSALQAASAITVQCLYPAVRFTTPNLYLRTTLASQSLESSALAQPTDQSSQGDILDTNILGVIPVNTEICKYQAYTDRVFQLDIGQSAITAIKLFVQDEHGRSIGRTLGDSYLNTSGGTGTAQSTLGNLNFSCVLRADIIQIRPPTNSANIKSAEKGREPFGAKIDLTNPSQIRQGRY